MHVCIYYTGTNLNEPSWINIEGNKYCLYGLVCRSREKYIWTHCSHTVLMPLRPYYIATNPSFCAGRDPELEQRSLFFPLFFACAELKTTAGSAVVYRMSPLGRLSQSEEPPLSGHRTPSMLTSFCTEDNVLECRSYVNQVRATHDDVFVSV